MLETVVGMIWFSIVMLVWAEMDRSHSNTKGLKMLGFVINTIFILAYIYAGEAGTPQVGIVQSAAIFDGGLLVVIFVLQFMDAFLQFWESFISIIKRLGG